jgi:hypothetical protein
MNSTLALVLKVLRRLHARLIGSALGLKPECIYNPDEAAQCIQAVLEGDRPAMIARFGSNELVAVVNYTGVKSGVRSCFGYIQGRVPAWWWNSGVVSQMSLCAGFFPADTAKLEAFAELMLTDMPYVDVLGSWLPEERLFGKELANALKVDLDLLNPYFSREPWTRALAGKKVLVVHPFASTIRAQYAKRELLFKNDLLPAFELKTIKAVQSIAGEKTEFADWFAALESMKAAMDREDYDICLIGCGAYGFPLAAHAKRAGKKAFHLGGSLQLLFGIRGKRWEDPAYHPDYNFAGLMNEHWVKPGEDERPKSAGKVEGACYW